MKVIVCFIFLIAVTLAEDANEKLKKCCNTYAGKVDKECLERYCDFDAISQTNVLNFLSKCTERGTVVGNMFSCASSNVDHTKCCESKGVSGKCLEYCTAQDGVPTNYLDYLFCLENFNQIRDCFKDYLETHDPVHA
uniref:DB domain-containing protein n=1 Tax=Ascaris lumbricoides TaxID=6252 RepID=A0A0M3IUS8_ASCLU